MPTPSKAKWEQPAKERFMDERGRFLPGNPGKPKGARAALGQAFIEDLFADWKEHGKTAIASVRADKPEHYLKVVASILPKELNVKVGELDDLTDEQLAAQFARIAHELAEAGIALVSGNAAPEGAQPAGGVSTLQ